MNLNCYYLPKHYLVSQSNSIIYLSHKEYYKPLRNHFGNSLKLLLLGMPHLIFQEGLSIFCKFFIHLNYLNHIFKNLSRLDDPNK